MITVVTYERWAGGGWGWYVVATGEHPDDRAILADGYARTALGARWGASRARTTLGLRWWPKETWGQLSYAIRPYDMLADRRRWFWQRRQRCGFFR